MNYTIEKKNDALILRHVQKANFKQKYLFISDLHIDSDHFDKKLFDKLCTQAVEENAGIFIIGDLFDAMGHDHDKRSTKAEVKNRHQQSIAYFNSIVHEAVEVLAPYAQNICLISSGNHEDSVKRRQEVDILSLLKYELYHKTKIDIQLGGYFGWVWFQFKRKNNSSKRSKKLFYTHGKGGNAVVTHGVLNTGRRQAAIDADIIISGHVHKSFNVPLGKYYLNQDGTEMVKEVLHLQMGTFEDNTSWARANEFPPASKSGWWIEFNYQEAFLDVLEIRAK